MATPNILFVCRGAPRTPRSGAQVRAYQLARALETAGHLELAVASPLPLPQHQIEEMEQTFHVARFVATGTSPVGWGTDRWRHEFDPNFMNTAGYVVAPSDREWMLQAINRYDVVWVYSMLLANMFRIQRWQKSIIDIDDVQHRVARDHARVETSWLRKARCYRQAWIWKRREMRAFDRFDVVTVTSNADRDAFGQEHSVFTVPNSFDMPDPPPTRNVQRNRLGFIGNLGFAPNRDGLQWFVNRVWPLVRHAVPNAELRIAGAGSETLVIPDGKGIVRLGWVPDIDEELASWNATVAPIRYGGGSSIKVAETIAKGCPVIATTAGVRGFELRDGCHASIADSPRALAEACIRHLRDPELGPRLAENAMKLFVERYAPPVVAKAVQQVVEACLGRAAEERPCSNSVAR